MSEVVFLFNAAGKGVVGHVVCSNEMVQQKKWRVHVQSV